MISGSVYRVLILMVVTVFQTLDKVMNTLDKTTMKVHSIHNVGAQVVVEVLIVANKEIKKFLDKHYYFSTRYFYK
jgi:hypothetical protein